MRILMTGTSWFATASGGLTRYFEELLRALQASDGCEVVGAAFGQAPPGQVSWGDLESRMPVRVLRSRRRPPEPVDLVDRHFALYGATPRGAARVVHFHGPWAEESDVAGFGRLDVEVKRRIEQRRYASAEAVIVLSRAFGDLVVREFGLDPDRVHVIPPGVDLDHFSPQPLPSAPHVVCVRRLERRCGVDMLIEAWPTVTAAVPDARLTVIGKGPEEESLRALAARVDPRITLAGFVDELTLRTAYAEASCTVVPTRALEGFGLIGTESLSAGRAPVVTRVGGLPDAVTGLDPSLVVAPEGPAIAQRLIRALQGEVPSAEACRAHAETFAWEQAAQKHLAVYDDLLTRRGR